MGYQTAGDTSRKISLDFVAVKIVNRVLRVRGDEVGAE